MTEQRCSGQVVGLPPGAATSPVSEVFDTAVWLDAPDFSTIGRCVTDAGWFDPARPHCDLDALDWWFHCSLLDATSATTQPLWLQSDGLSVGAEVFADEQLVFTAESANIPVTVRIPAGTRSIWLRFRSLLTQLDALRSVDRAHPARWRTRLVADQRLRLVRTPLLGRMPGWNPPLPVIGSHGNVRLSARRSPVEVSRTITANPDGSQTVVIVTMVDLAASETVRVHISGGDALTEALCDAIAADIEMGGATEADELTRVTASVHVARDGFRRWWPHTHGIPATSLVELCIATAGFIPVDDGANTESHELARLAFRDVVLHHAGPDGRHGTHLTVNGTKVFVRGANWIPVSAADPFTEGESTRAALQDCVTAGMNLVRVAGTTVIPPEAFLDACDALGILVWHDLPFANLDVPLGAPALRDLIHEEVLHLARRAATHACVAVLCGGSEVEQQAAMAGASPAVVDDTLGRTFLAELCAFSAPTVSYVTSSPSPAPGSDAVPGEAPHHHRSGVSHYFGVSAYRRPLLDARTSEVGFATECLAFANVPTAGTVDTLMGNDGPVVHHPRWKQRVPRDRGAGWDFDDVRDAMTEQLFGVSPTALRWADPAAALDLGRITSAEAVDATLTEWRREHSRCSGAIVWTGRDLWDGAGWGLTEATGVRKAAWYGFARRSQPVIVGLTDEGLNGVDVHLVNDRGTDIHVILDVGAWAETGPVLTASRPMTLGARSAVTLPAATLFQDFRDLTGVYAFGPAAIELVRARLRSADGQWISDAHLWPKGRPHAARRGDTLEASISRSGYSAIVHVAAPAGAFGVRVDARGWTAGDAWFHLAPGDFRDIPLTPTGPQPASLAVIRALSVASSVTLQIPAPLGAVS